MHFCSVFSLVSTHARKSVIFTYCLLNLHPQQKNQEVSKIERIKWNTGKKYDCSAHEMRTCDYRTYRQLLVSLRKYKLLFGDLSCEMSLLHIPFVPINVANGWEWPPDAWVKRERQRQKYSAPHFFICSEAWILRTPFLPADGSEH